MGTYRDIISSIRSMSKLLSSDLLISDRVVLQEVMSARNLLVGQMLTKRRGWNSPTLFTMCPCLDMETVPLSDCCEYTSDVLIARSKKTLPKIGEGMYGLAVQNITGLDGKKKLKQSTPDRYANLLTLGVSKNDVYFWMQESKLYITNSESRTINLFAFFTEPVPNDLLFPGVDCNCKAKPSVDSLCANPLDQTFHFVAEREKDLKDIVYNNLLKVFYGIEIDKTSNNLDESQRR